MCSLPSIPVCSLNKNTDRGLTNEFQTFCNRIYAMRGGITTFYIRSGKVTTKRGQMCELEMRTMWSLPFLDLYLGPAKRVMTIKGP